MMSNSRRYRSLPRDQFQAVHLAAEEFEAALQRNEEPSIESYLRAASPLVRNALFAELLAIELTWQFARDQSPNLSDLRRRFPKRKDCATRLFEEISQEPTQRIAAVKAGHGRAAYHSHDPEEKPIEEKLAADEQLSRSSGGVAVPQDAASRLHGVEQSGSNIGPYELLEVIGTGGMGSVWRAQQRHPVNREVAIKLIKMGMDTRQVVARFEAERQALALMNHPNIANVFDAGSTVSGRPFIVMELVKGEQITSYCDAHRLTMESRLKLFVDVCDAVQHAHHKGVIHRDLKPSNVLVAGSHSNPIPKVIDFGLAKATEQKLVEETIFTAVGQVIGTPNCMSPEQATLSNHDIDTRTDVYSLGVLLYELLSGVTPFEFQSGTWSYDTMLRCIRQDEVPRMSSRLGALGDRAFAIAEDRQCHLKNLRYRLRGDLDVIVQKALEKDRDRRYQSPRDMADDIQRYLNRETIEARPASLMYRFKKTASRNIAAVIFVTLLTASMLIGATVSLRQAIRAIKAEKELAAQLVVARRLALEADDRTKTERWERYRSTMDAVSDAMYGAEDIGLARRNLDSAPEEHRDWEWLHFDSRLQDSSTNVLHVAKADLSYCPVFALHPTRWELAMHQPDGSAAIWNPEESMAAVSQTAYPNGASAIAYSSAGDRVAVAADNHVIHVWNTNTGEHICELAGHQSTVLKLCFHPNGSHLASGGFDHQVHIWDVETGESVTVRELSSRCTALGYSADGARLMIGSTSELVSVGAADHEIVARFEGPTAEIVVASISRDGRFIAGGTSDSENKLFVWDFRSGDLLATMEGHNNQISNIAFDVDGSRIASVSIDQTVRLWDVKSGENLSVLRGHTAPIYGLAFSPDGRQIVSASDDETVRLWDAETARPVAVLRGHRADVAQVAYSHDGSKIISASFDGTVRIWDSALDRTNVLRGHTRFAYDVAFSPSGGRIASVGWDGRLLQWNLSRDQPIDEIQQPADVLTSVVFDSNGDRLITLSRHSNDNREGRSVMVWDQASGDLLQSISVPGPNWQDTRADVRSELPQHATDPKQSRGGVIAVGDDAGRILLFDLETGKQQAALQGHTKAILDVAFRPVFHHEGAVVSHLATASKDLKIRIWDVEEQREVACLSGHQSDINRVLYSRDGRLLASASNDKTVRLWECGSYRFLAELPHGSNVYGLAFNPEGTRLATGCGDNTIRLWDVERHQEVARLQGHEQYVHAVSFSPDGSRLASASGDSTIRIWDTLSPNERVPHP